MLTVMTFLWGQKYGTEYVDRLAAGVARHLATPYKFICAVDRPRQFKFPHIHQTPIKDIPLTKTETNGCLARMRLFDPEWQRELGLVSGDRVLVLDVDLIILRDILPLALRSEPFVILQGVNYHGGRFNGSIWLTTAGYRPDVWTDFDPNRWPKHVPHFGFPNDQAWFEYKMPDAGAYTPAQDQVYAIGKPGWPKGTVVPDDARIVAFPGSRDPGQFVNMAWVRKNWLGIA